MAEALHLNQFKLEFSNDVQLLLQEKGSKLRDRVMIGMHTGSRGASPVNQVSSTAAAQPAGRFAPMGRIDSTFERRWVTPQDWEHPQLLDKFDMLKYSQDFKGPYAENAAMAIGRAMDDAIIDAAAGTSAIGELGAGSESFDTTNFRVAANFGAGADVGLTVAKMIELRRKFAAANVDLDAERPTLVITPTQEAELLNQVEVVSTDYNMRPVLVDGRVKQFLGIDLVVSNRGASRTTNVPFGYSSASLRRCFAFVKSGVHLGMWKDIETRVDERKDLSSMPWQIYACASFGATRLEQGKVIEVLCNEA